MHSEDAHLHAVSETLRPIEHRRKAPRNSWTAVIANNACDVVQGRPAIIYEDPVSVDGLVNVCYCVTIGYSCRNTLEHSDIWNESRVKK